MKRWLNGKTLSAVGFLLLIGLIWFVGPFFGIESVEARYFAIFCVMLVWVVVLMAGRFVSERAGRLLERMLRKQADDAVMAATPEKRAEVTVLRSRLLEAIETLKKSNLGKTRGKAVLYGLPWYLVIGHPAAGKSSAVSNSGLTFPFAEKGKIAVQGVGGTRNCDWFFSTEGVLLDTAGRYATQSADRAEWIEFLRLLRRHRPAMPANGILVAISLPELMQHKSEAFTLYARQVRERISEIDATFGARVPVYLLFTKLDLLSGFSQFFADLSEDDRHRPWGAALPHDQGADFDAARIVGQHFELLRRGLEHHGMTRLALDRGNVQRPALFSFPIEFGALREAVTRFVELLFQEDPYHTRPLLRGFYFTSALQEGSPRVAAGAQVASQFDLARSGAESAQTPQSHGYFLRDVFRDVLFPDQFLVSRQTRPVAGRLRLAGIAAGLAGLALIAGAWSWSFLENQTLIARAQSELVSARARLKSDDVAKRLSGLVALQSHVEQLYRFRSEGHPWSLGVGLYRGAEVEAVMRAEYFAGVRALMLSPVKEQLEAHLAQLASAGQAGEPLSPTKATRSPANHVSPTSKNDRPGSRPALDAGEIGRGLEESYNTLKTYLMLAQRERMDASHLSDQLPRHWRTWLADEQGQQLAVDSVHGDAARVIAFYLSQLEEEDLPLIENRQDVVASSREILRGAMQRLSGKERVYNELKARANTQFAPLTVARILGSKDLDLVAGSHAVPGAFTRDAWDKYFRDAIAEAAKGEIRGDDWVLATSLLDNLGRDGNAERNRAELEALYKAEYADEWAKFLQGVAVHEFPSLEQAATRLGKLAEVQASPIRLILARAAHETGWEGPSGLQRTLEGAKNTVLNRVRLTTAARPDDPAAEERGLGQRFALLTQLAVPDATGGTGLSSYLDLLQKAKGRIAGIAASSDPGAGARQFMQATLSASGSELADALQLVDGTLLASVDGTTRDMLRPLLVRPLIAAYAALIPPAQADINHLWGQQVWGSWIALAGKYPFADASNEAEMADISKFLKPGEGTLPRFVERVLGPLIARRGEHYVPRTWADRGINLHPAFLAGLGRLTSVGNTVLQEGEGSKFELQPVPTPGLSDITIEIDGQQLRYRNGPQAWFTFAWPKGNAVHGARLQIVSFSGASVSVANHPGRLGLMRLLAQASADNPAAPTVHLEWRTRAADVTTGDGEGTPVRFNFRMVSGANPLALSGLRRVALPQTIAN